MTEVLADKLRELVAISHAITGTLDYDQVLHLVVEKTAQFTRADSCALLLADADDRARVVAARGIDPDKARDFDAPLDERINTAVRDLIDFRPEDTFLGAPVIARGQVRGVLMVYRRGPDAPDPDEEFLLTALADQAALALEHASRYQDVRQLSERRARLLETILSTTSSYLAYLNPDLRIAEANPAFCRALGVDREQLVGRGYTEVFAEPDIAPLLDRACESGRGVEVRALPVAADGRGAAGEIAYWDWAARPVLDDQGDVEGLVISAVDVTEAVRARRELEVSSHRKDEFLAMLAHELRNPLAAMASAIEVMRRRLPDDPTSARVQGVAARQIDHMKRLLGDLLDVSRITRGKIELKRANIDIGAIAKEAVQTCSSFLNEREHDLEVSLPDEPVLIHGDRDRLLQVLSNMLTNSGKYTSRGGRLSLVVERSGGGVNVRVRDTGAGIARDVLPHIFDLFVQSGRGLDRGQGGLGIGLTVVKNLVEMHGGHVEARSEGPGRGSEFIIWLPALAVRAPAEPETRERGSTVGALHQILVVEDNADAAEMLANVLELDGHRVRVAHDASSALDAARNERPDVVVLDIGLPGIDGYELSRRLRRRMERQPLIVAVTGYGRESDRQQAREAGVDHHLIKPVDPEQLRHVLADRSSSSSSADSP